MARDPVQIEILRAVVATFVGMFAAILLPMFLISVALAGGSPWLWVAIAGLVLIAWAALRTAFIRTLNRRIPARALGLADGGDTPETPSTSNGVYWRWMSSSPIEKLVLVDALRNGVASDDARARIRGALERPSGSAIMEDFRGSVRKNVNRGIANVLAFGAVVIFFVWRILNGSIPGSGLVADLVIASIGSMYVTVLVFFGARAYADGLIQARDALDSLGLSDPVSASSKVPGSRSSRAATGS